ncbi:undecaprenyldiphospho-muramoylpentapeptide beta-N-acetylglucosaminyltransferase [Pelagibaculum spongiae]|uniref:UDP-N-acetylglucosamine--N-acetylmuramyl-(pentapeptide) pyrophosphoryl-undecaprenol N-acetylglucosamine transferase n=1 Tax=Pelagibaculum spongiae TaxID=2080658 RepID=A0A2V1GXH4_9GAMM|nr:undecaprenyldiphospho-muramoylpentapeptide beta-N-acetylglucosaminyltransferase [Pelagibaculum spongiae]PVZ71871.1 undecaprenyldiphospho-muramoylpentapeptide beta-N-acetylglucosaminyltransferase [Pelagibaculum spongiae]
MSRVLVMAGGTGGHIYPALAVAKNLTAKGWQVEWLGTPRGLENQLVPQAGFPLNHISVSGVRGKGVAGLLAAPWKILKSCLQARKLLKQLKPDLVIGFGGFASGPGGLMASVMNIPLVIHEQNAIAGTTNKILAGRASRVLQAFPNALKNGVVTGNPVRDEIVELSDLVVAEAIDSSVQKKLKLLIVGGSLGALALNKAMPAVASGLADKVEVWHQTGARTLEIAQQGYAEQSLVIEPKVTAYIDDMASAYAWADLVVCRAGALTVSEVAAAGLPAIFIPFPQAIDDHQTANAGYLVDKDAAVLLAQSDLTSERLQKLIESYLTPEGRKQLAQMASNAKKAAIVDATEVVVKHCLEVTGG